jgi:DNA-binding LytR/AlgR family response regulator
MTTNIKVLVVEDKALVAEDIASKLRKHSLEVTAICSSGEEAIELLRNSVPDLILMDIQLAGKMDGITTAEVIRKHHKMPILYLSDFTDEDTLRRAKKTLPENYLSKPFQEHDLIRAIDIAFYNSQNRISGNRISPEFVFLRTEGQVYVKIPLRDILYLEANRAYCSVVCSDKTHLLSTSMNHVYDQIEAGEFVKVNRSFIVNADRIDGFDGNTVKIREKEIVINKEGKEQLMRRFKFIK